MADRVCPAHQAVDTAGIPTTWGAEPYRNRIPGQAGAVRVAKLSLGAMALNDIWFGDIR